MPDLHARFRAFDGIQPPDLWAEIERRAAALPTMPVAPVTAGSASWRGGRAPDQPGSTRRLVLALVVLALALAAVVGAAVAGGLFRDRLLADVPPIITQPSPQPAVTDATQSTVAPSSQPSPSVAPEGRPEAVSTQAFSSALYGYSIRLPGGWASTPATSAWSGTGDWDQPPSADTMSGEGAPDPSGLGTGATHTLTVVAADVPVGTTLETWTDAHPIDRDLYWPEIQACRVRLSGGGSRMFPGGPGTWSGGFIGGHPAQVRSECGYLDGVVIVDDRIYIFSLLRAWVLDFGTYERLTRTVTFGDQPIPAPVLTTFTSTRYGYSIAVSSEYSPIAAAFAWAPSEAFGRGFDRFEGWWGATIRIASAPIPEAANQAEWLATVVPQRFDAACEGHPQPWRATSIAGFEGFVRSASVCIEVAEAYLTVDHRLYAFQATNATEEELLTFLATIEFRPEDAAVAT